MGRLTKKHGKLAVQIGGETRRNDIGWLRLAQYEDLVEQGRLIEVIRCSECEHYDNVGCADGCGWCDYWDIGRFTDGYCDKAKLKELEGENEKY